MRVNCLPRETVSFKKDSVNSSDKYCCQNDLPNIKYQNSTSKKLAFGAIWDYYTYSSNPYRKAEVSINRYSTAAAATAGTLAQTVVGDAAALTLITRNMCKSIFEIHGLPYGGYTATLGSTIVGKMVGVNMATTLLTIHPVAGNAINATIAYGLHQITGRSLNEMCNDMRTSGEDLANLKYSDLVSKFTNLFETGIHGIKNEHVCKFAKKFVESFK